VIESDKEEGKRKGSTFLLVKPFPYENREIREKKLVGVTGFRSLGGKCGPGRVSLGFACGFDRGLPPVHIGQNKNGRPKENRDDHFYGRCDWI
jgi:hypothetical protein